MRAAPGPTYLSRDFKDSDIEEEVREAFQVFDREGNGFITTPDLLEVMQTIGDMLSSDEAQVPSLKGKTLVLAK